MTADERIERQAEIAALVTEAFRRFRPHCFCNVSDDRPRALLIPLVVRRLGKYGGIEGLKPAAKLQALNAMGLRAHDPVATATGDTTRIHGSADFAVSFVPPVEDEVFGYRLHDLDLAVTKVLAMAGRREARDYYDVIKLHQAGKKLDDARLGCAGQGSGVHAGIDPGRDQSAFQLFRQRAAGRICRCRAAGHEENLARSDA